LIHEPDFLGLSSFDSKTFFKLSEINTTATNTTRTFFTIFSVKKVVISNYHAEIMLAQILIYVNFVEEVWKHQPRPFWEGYARSFKKPGLGLG